MERGPEMCLQKFIRYTFSNKDALTRLIEIVEKDFGEKLPRGEVYVIREYRKFGEKLKHERDTYPYDVLSEYLEMFYSPFKKWDRIDFGTWEEFREMKRRIMDELDVFGYMEIEVLVGG
jgi:hypothetical protein